MKYCLTAFLSVFIASSSLAQEFQISKGTDLTEIFYSSIQLPDKSYISCGLASGYGEGGLNMLATRTNSIGETMWTKVYTSGGNEDMRSMDMAPDGSIYSCGYTYTPKGNIQIAYTKINTDGSIAFSKQFGGAQGDAGEELVAIPDGGFAVLGSTQSYNQTPDSDCILTRFDSEGELLWATGFGTASGESPKSLSITQNGHFLVSATYRPDPEEGLKTMISVLDSNGQLVRSLHIGHGPDNDIARGVIGFNGGYLIFGETYNTSTGSTEVFFVHTDLDFNVIWQKMFGGDLYEHITAAVADDENTFTVCGQTSTLGAGGVDGYIAQFDNTGEIIWMKTYGGDSKDIFFNLLPTSDDGYIISGYNRSFTSSFSNAWIIKTNERGDCACNQSAATTLPTYGVSLDIQLMEVSSYPIDDTPTDWELTTLNAEDIFSDLICSFGIEEDGTDSTDEVTSVSEGNSNIQLEVYPNPSEGMVYLTMPNITEDQTLQVYSLSGKLITRKHIPATYDDLYPLDLSDLGVGVYIIQMVWSGGVYSKRLSIK
ncbi:MAG: hypothetical protein ACI9RU_001529 [Litorivivens sp.]|jgi:hypothetical protein